MDKRVEIHGATWADMNSKRGVATNFHYCRADGTKDRYTVKLDGGEAFKVKPANVRAEGTAVGGGGIGRWWGGRGQGEGEQEGQGREGPARA